jgi:hypothetical protein
LNVLLIQRAVELFSSLTWGQDGTEAYAVVAFVVVAEFEGRVAADANRRPAVDLVAAVVVTAASEHPFEI